MPRFLDHFSFQSRFWENNAYWVILILGAVGIVNCMVQGWFEPSRFFIVALGIIGLMWLGLAVANGRSWRRTLRDWQRSLDSWKESNLYAQDLGSLLNEAVTDLSTWDRDKAEDIWSRANTIAMMRAQKLRDETRGVEG